MTTVTETDQAGKQAPLSSAPLMPIHNIVEQIREAWSKGKRIVPIVGAGLSADSGIPVIASLMRFFLSSINTLKIVHGYQLGSYQI
jgi:hypothetical protein